MTLTLVTDCPYYLLTRASLAVTAALRRELAAAGFPRVRPAYIGVLMCLWREDGLQAVELGRRAGLEPSTMTGMLDRMERDRLVERRPDPADRRAQRIVLTEEGRRCRGVVDELVDRVLARAFDGVADEGQDALKTALRRVLDNVTR